jgi:hypothetical protein
LVAALTGMFAQSGLADGVRLIGPVVEFANENFQYSRASYSPAEDHYLILWNWPESGNLRLLGRCVNASTGQLAGPRFQVGPNAGVGAPVYNPDEGYWFVVYASDADIGGDLYAQKVNASGPVGGAVPLVEEANFQQRPAADYDLGRHRYLVAWADYRPGKPEIRCRLFDQNGSTVAGCPEYTISEYSSRAQTDPMVVYNPVADEFLVVWMDARHHIYAPPGTNDNDYIDLYGQRVSAATGAPVGANIPVNSPYVEGSPYVGDGQDTLGGVGCNTTPSSPLYGTYFVYIQKLLDPEGWTTQARMLNADGTHRGPVFNVSHPWRGGVAGFVYNPFDDTWFASYLDRDFDVSGQQFTAAGLPIRDPDTLIAVPGWEENYGSLAVRPSDGQYLQVTVKFENFITGERPSILEFQRFVRDNTAPSPAAQLTITAGLRRATLRWLNPAAGDFAGTLIRMRSDACPTGPANGSLVVNEAGSPVEFDSFVHGGLTPGTTYHYAVFAHDGLGNYATGVCGDVTIGTPGDTDLDDDVDQSDFGYFQSCLSEEGVQHPAGCEDADFDTDGDVDGTDLDAFRACLGGPGQPPGC